MDLIFIHGWGQSSQFTKSLGQIFEKDFTCHYLDLPGFGGTDAPTSVWGSDDYAREYVQQYCREHGITRAVFVGHSMGGKVSMEMALQFPELSAAIILIASNGAKKKRSFGFKAKANILKALSRLAGVMDKIFKTSIKQAYGKKFGSADYRAASGIMKSILVKTVNENYEDKARNIHCPTLLIYGENDDATPPEVGQRLAAVIPQSSFVEIPHQDHYTVLSSGRFQVQNQMKNFLQTIEK